MRIGGGAAAGPLDDPVGGNTIELSRWLVGAAVDHTFPLRSLLASVEAFARAPVVRGEPVEFEEGCLSVPDLTFPTRRFPWARSIGTDLDGQPVEVVGEGVRGPITAQLGATFEDALRGRDARYADWLDIVDVPAKVATAT